jgi:hypothetical protein
MRDLEQIKKILKDHKDILRQRYSVDNIAIFGSYVREEQSSESDVDILVEFARPVGFVTFMKLESYLSELIGRKVDLVTRKALKPNMGKTILQELVHV